MRLVRPLVAFMLAAAFCGPAAAAEALPLAGQSLPFFWALPFAGLLLSLAFLPVVAPRFWHTQFGKISLFWAAAFLLPAALAFGPAPAASAALHSLIAEYMPFMIILVALYTVMGGIYIEGNLRASPAMNTAFLSGGALLAGIVGTTGASMALIRPLIRANDARPYNAHVVVFFIFLVSNIGGALTPLGDPPLFIGYLKGVGFFWPTAHLLLPMLFCLAILLPLFFVLDSYIFNRDGQTAKDPTPATKGLRMHGRVNIAFMALIVAIVLAAPALDLGALALAGIEIPVGNLLRDALLLLVVVLSLKLTPRAARSGNEFDWGPAREVGLLFLAIFITAAPVLAMLSQGKAGTLSGLVQAVSTDGAPDPLAYFWLSGVLSAFLDNAPTYLVFFQMAGGDAQQLMGPLAKTLMGISCGAVFMGALSYIGNAPNFMVRTIAEGQGVRMPSFFGYMGWACLVLAPVFALIGLLFFS